MPLSPAQRLIAQNQSRFRIAVCGRRFGKTHIAIRELARHAAQPERTCWYIAPTYRQAKQIVWRKLKRRLQSINWVAKTNENDLELTLVNGSTISLKGADNYDSLRGVGLNLLVIDDSRRPRPVTMAPAIEPIPPITTTAKTTMIRFDPITAVT